MTARGNLLYGRRRAEKRGGLRPEASDFDSMVDLLGIEKLLDRRPLGMSGGERSRVALGRALLAHPDALLLDEPLAALDAARKAEIFPYLERLRDEAKIPMLYVSHSLDEVTRLAERMIVVSEGRVVTAGSVFEVASKLELGGHTELPLLGAILPARVVRHDSAHSLTELRLGAAASGEVPAGGCWCRCSPARWAKRSACASTPTTSCWRAASPPGSAPTMCSRLRSWTFGPIPDGPYADVRLAVGEQRLVARITRFSLNVSR